MELLNCLSLIGTCVDAVRRGQSAVRCGPTVRGADTVGNLAIYSTVPIVLYREAVSDIRG